MSFANDRENAASTSTTAQVLELIDPATQGHKEFIKRAHGRSCAAGLDTGSKVDIAPPPRATLRELIEKNDRLRSCALPFMETLYEQVVNTHSMVLLTDASGTIIESLGDDDFLVKAQKVALAPGVTWSEEHKGTNAIGTALIEELPTVVHGQDHFLDVNRFLTCSAAPIFDPQGVAIGVLDVTGDYRSYHRHTMGLVRMSAQMIENHLFNSSFQEAIIVQFHQRGEFLGSVVEGAAAFSPAGKFLAANRAAMVQFGMSSNALKSHTFSSLFGMPLSSLIDHYRTCNPLPLTLCLLNGNQVTARASLGSVGRGRIFDSVGLVKNAGEPAYGATAPAQSSQGFKPAPGCQKNRNLSSLKYLNTGDPQVAKVIDKVGKVIDKDIPILILGETGTGKEILAQAIHNDSPRSDKPFVAVNCASIPETLIESELFGYEDGAFTGAKKKGSQGRILQANGGTLFLDEIGDMPISLQARLLRVLQERVVTPLGSQKSIPVNLQVVCATHRNLRDLIAVGDFREDLYYRLHGLVVKLPALRERTDLAKIIQRILENESPVAGMTVAPDVMEAFKSHSWPGNIRQLTNILRTGSVMADESKVIQWDHLPDDFQDEWNSLRKQPAAPLSTQPVTSTVAEFAVPFACTEPVKAIEPASKRPQFTIRTSGQQMREALPGANALAVGPTAAAARPAFAFQVQRHGVTAPTASAGSKPDDTQFGKPKTGGLDQTFSKYREGRFGTWSSARKPDASSAATPAMRPASVHTASDQASDFYRHDARAQGYIGARNTVMRPASGNASNPINLEDLESQAIQDALEACRGNVSAAARMLGISRNTIYRRLNSK